MDFLFKILIILLSPISILINSLPVGNDNIWEATQNPNVSHQYTPNNINNPLHNQINYHTTGLKKKVTFKDISSDEDNFVSGGKCPLIPLLQKEVNHQFTLQMHNLPKFKKSALKNKPLNAFNLAQNKGSEFNLEETIQTLNLIIEYNVETAAQTKNKTYIASSISPDNLFNYSKNIIEIAWLYKNVLKLIYPELNLERNLYLSTLNKLKLEMESIHKQNYFSSISRLKFEKLNSEYIESQKQINYLDDALLKIELHKYFVTMAQANQITLKDTVPCIQASGNPYYQMQFNEILVPIIGEISTKTMEMIEKKYDEMCMRRYAPMVNDKSESIYYTCQMQPKSSSLSTLPVQNMQYPEENLANERQKIMQLIHQKIQQKAQASSAVVGGQNWQINGKNLYQANYYPNLYRKTVGDLNNVEYEKNVGAIQSQRSGHFSYNGFYRDNYQPAQIASVPSTTAFSKTRTLSRTPSSIKRMMESLMRKNIRDQEIQNNGENQQNNLQSRTFSSTLIMDRNNEIKSNGSQQIQTDGSSHNMKNLSTSSANDGQNLSNRILSHILQKNNKV